MKIDFFTKKILNIGLNILLRQRCPSVADLQRRQLGKGLSCPLREKKSSNLGHISILFQIESATRSRLAEDQGRDLVRGSVFLSVFLFIKCDPVFKTIYTGTNGVLQVKHTNQNKHKSEILKFIPIMVFPTLSKARRR